MRVLMLSGASHATSQAMLEVVHELVARGVEVHVAMWAPPSASLRATATSIVVWGRQQVLPDSPPQTTFTGPVDATDSSASDAETGPHDAATPPSRRPSRRVQHYQKQSLRVLNRLKRVGQSGRTWRHVRRDPQLLARSAQADVIVAVDTQAVLAAWKLARRHAVPNVVYGLSAGRGVITRRLSATTR